MSVTLSNDGAIELAGVCPMEDAESLLRILLKNPGLPVDWSQCEEAHTAVIQVLLAVRPAMRGSPFGARLKRWIEPLVRRGDIAVGQDLLHLQNTRQDPWA